MNIMMKEAKFSFILKRLPGYCFWLHRSKILLRSSLKTFSSMSEEEKQRNQEDRRKILEFLNLNSNEVLEKPSKKDPEKFVLLARISKLRYSIAGTLCIGILIYRELFLCVPFMLLFTIKKFISETGLSFHVQSQLEDQFADRKNRKIIYGYESMKKYIFLHPELKKHFQEKNTAFHGNSWSPYRQNYIGSGLKHEEKLTDKRWELATRIINQETELQAFVTCQILYFSPTDFVIEYLRVDLSDPYYQKITIIDGRRDIKTWIEEYEDKDIRKKYYPKYRKGEEVQY